MTTTTLDVQPAIGKSHPTGARLWAKHGEAITTALCALFVATRWLASRDGVGTAGTSAILQDRDRHVGASRCD
jgi:hypothetical protein